jgi:hypothetical protein
MPKLWVAGESLFLLLLDLAGLGLASLQLVLAVLALLSLLARRLDLGHETLLLQGQKDFQVHALLTHSQQSVSGLVALG